MKGHAPPSLSRTNSHLRVQAAQFPLASSGTSQQHMSPSSGHKKHRRPIDKLPNGQSSSASRLPVDAVGASANGNAFAVDPTGVMAIPHAGHNLPPELLLQFQQQFQAQQTFQQQQQAMTPVHPGNAAAFRFPMASMQPPMQPMPALQQTYSAPFLHPAILSAPTPLRHASSAYQPQQQPPQSQLPVDTAVDGDLVRRMEKKEQMMSQLGSFLSQMQQESEGTTHAWKETLVANAELKQLNSLLTQQLEQARASDEEARAQLVQVTQDLETALQALKDMDAKHVEELTIMDDEIKRRAAAAEEMTSAHEQRVKSLEADLQTWQQDHQEAIAKAQSLEEAMRKAEQGHRMVLEQAHDDHEAVELALADARAQLAQLDKDKQELGAHLWNATREIEQVKQAVVEWETKHNAVVTELENVRQKWSDQCQQLQHDRAEQGGRHAMLQQQVHELDAQCQTERAQKEELNALMLREMRRFQDEMEQLEQQHQQTIAQVVHERDQWQHQALVLQEQHTAREREAAALQQELEALRLQAERINEENQHLQAHGSEKASTLQELNAELRHALSEMHAMQTRYQQMESEHNALETGVRQCMQVLNGSSTSGAGVSDFPGNVLKALDDLVQLRSTMEQVKVSMLRLQQDQDNERERARAKEQDLQQQLAHARQELATTRQDAATLAGEVDQLTRANGGHEAQWQAQVDKLTKELDDVRGQAALQVLQLQKALESQRQRAFQLESDKNDLLHEAEHVNASMAALYQTKNALQTELDQLKSSWKEQQLELADVKDSYDDLEAQARRTADELNARLSESQSQLSQLRSRQQDSDKQWSALQAAHTTLQSEHDAVVRQLQSEQGRSQEEQRSLQSQLDDKMRRMDEMVEMLTQLRAKTEFLEQARSQEEHATRQEVEKLQQQALAAAQDKKRIELQLAHAKTQLETQMHELATLQEEKRQFVQTHTEMDEELAGLRSENARCKGELERLARAKSGLQVELHRVTDEAQDVLRQFEVLRRDARLHEQTLQSELEKARKDVDDLRIETSESNALAEELQTKLTSIQSAANATINDLMSELQHAQETLTFDKGRLQKEIEKLKLEAQALEEDARRKEHEAKDAQLALRMTKDQALEKENELTMKLTRATHALDQKKNEVEKLGKELEARTAKCAEYERKWTPMMHAKEALQTKQNELKQALDHKTREAHDVETRLRDDLAKLIKDKRELDAVYVTLREEHEALRAHTSGYQQQWQSDNKTLKQSLERAKAELARANADVQALTQRLESCQNAANETVAELSARLQAADQQREISLHGVQRELHLERERRREAEVQKMELQRLLRQRGGSSNNNNSSSNLSNSSSNNNNNVMTNGEDGGWGMAYGAPSVPDSEVIPTAQAPTPAAVTPVPSVSKAAVASEVRKFYANEPMSKTELANLPMALIKAQIGLDMANDFVDRKSPAPQRTPQRAPSPQVATTDDNNDDIPTLALDKLTQRPEADSADDDSSDRLTLSQKRTQVGASQSYLALLSGRSGSSERYAVAPLGEVAVKTRVSKHDAAGGKKQQLTKKKKPSGGGAGTAAAAGVYATLPTATATSSSSTTGGNSKPKSTSKLLPRISS